MVRQRRVQADARARLRRGLLPARRELRRRGPDGVLGRGVRTAAAGARAGLRAGRARVAGGARGRASRGSIRRSRSCGSAWTRSRRSSRAGASSTLPLAPANRADFMREVADVHRALFPGNEELYGENVRSKVERCLQVRDEEATAAERERADYFERVAEAVGELDLLVTPTVPFVAPPAEVDELEIRAGGDLAHVPDQLARLAGARAPVRPGRGRPARLGPARRPGGAKTPASSPPAACSNRCWRGSTGPLFPSNRLLLGRCAVTKPWCRRCQEVEEDCVRWPHPKCHLQRDGRDRLPPLSAKAPSRVDEDPHLLVTRPVEPHLGRGASNAAIHLGDGNGSSATAVRSRRGAVVGCEERRRARRHTRVAGVTERSGLRAGTAQ